MQEELDRLYFVRKESNRVHLTLVLHEEDYCTPEEMKEDFLNQLQEAYNLFEEELERGQLQPKGHSRV